MANIKIELFLDSNEQADNTLFLKLMTAFGGEHTLKQENLTVSNPPKRDPSFTPGYEVQTQKVDSNTPDTAEDQKETVGSKSEYTEAELKAMTNIGDVITIAKDLGIDPDSYEGKNTNKKVRELILDFYAGSLESPGAENNTEEAKNEKETKTALSKDSEISQNDLKAVLATKVEEHRDAIVKELKSYGATKLPNLSEEHYEAMYNYLTSL